MGEGVLAEIESHHQKANLSPEARSSSLRAINPSHRLGVEPQISQQTKPIVVLQPEDLDQQLQSPLYSGKIPAEIRKLIFDYAMAEYVDPNLLYPTNTCYTRPHFLGKKVVCINLLLVCKRSYFETRHLPPVNKTHVFWHGLGPPRERYRSDELGYFRRFQPAQLALVKEIHLFTQQWWLEKRLVHVCGLDVLQGIEKIKITLRRGDWNDHWLFAPLAITPQRADVDEEGMKDYWRREKVGEFVKWEEKCWGSAFRHLKSLKELEMEFETNDYKEKELDELVSHAATWKFPMGDGKVLSAHGLGGVKKESWRGPPCCWPSCNNCSRREELEPWEEWKEEMKDESCRYCGLIETLKAGGHPGPLLMARSLRWRVSG